MKASFSELMDRRDFLSSLVRAGSAAASACYCDRAVALSDRSTPDEMIGQMIIMGFWGSDPSSPGAQKITEWLKAGLIAGVIFFEDNLPSSAIVQNWIRAFREVAKPSVPLLCVDQEGGAVARLQADRGFEPLPSALSVGAMSRDKAAALQSDGSGVTSPWSEREFRSGRRPCSEPWQPYYCWLRPKLQRRSRDGRYLRQSVHRGASAQ